MLCDAASGSGGVIAGAEPFEVGASDAPGAPLCTGLGLVEDASSGAGVARVEATILLSEETHTRESNPRGEKPAN